jgi:SAM-dependent methyltransferase
VLLTHDRDQVSRARRFHEATVGNPRLYDVVQGRLGGGRIAERVSEALEGLEAAATLLDIGAGTGMVAGLPRGGAQYIWLDNDVHKLRGFLARRTRGRAVLGDASQLPFADDSVDWSVMVAVSHHVPDAVLEMCLCEVARVTRDRFVFLDAVRGRRARSRLLWQLDRGRFPRTEDELLTAISKSFEVTKVERFTKIHDYLLCVASSRLPQAPGTPG